jgi:hypothetical protein
MESGMKRPKLVQPLWDEADELTRIAVASIRTARASSSAIRNPKSEIRNRKERTANAQ